MCYIIRPCTTITTTTNVSTFCCFQAVSKTKCNEIEMGFRIFGDDHAPNDDATNGGDGMMREQWKKGNMCVCILCVCMCAFDIQGKIPLFSPREPQPCIYHCPTLHLCRRHNKHCKREKLTFLCCSSCYAYARNWKKRHSSKSGYYNFNFQKGANGVLVFFFCTRRYFNNENSFWCYVTSKKKIIINLSPLTS